MSSLEDLYSRNEISNEKTSAMETRQLLWMHFCICISEIREQNERLAFPRFPRKSSNGRAKAAARLSPDIHHGPRAEQAGIRRTPCTQRSRGMQMRARSQCAPLHLEDLRGLGGERTRTNTRFVTLATLIE